MHKLYISFGYDNKPIAVVIAENKDFAEVAFTAMDNGYSNMEEIDLSSDLLKNNKVSFILNSSNYKVSELPSNKDRKFRQWRRGR